MRRTVFVTSLDQAGVIQAACSRAVAAAERRKLAHDWLATNGPALEEDLRWWAGWTRAQTRRALGQLDLVEVELAGTGRHRAQPPDHAPQPDHRAATARQTEGDYMNSLRDTTEIDRLL